MLTIKTKLQAFTGKGIGLIAATPIKKGETVWLHDSLFTRTFTIDEVEQMTPEQHKFLQRYATPEPEGAWLLDMDDTRFMNHSRNPNVSFNEKDGKGIATRDIREGDEITCNYEALGVPVDFKVIP